MGKLREITDVGKHVVSMVICLKCYKRWLAVRPKGTRLVDLKCKICGKGFVIETGEIIDEE